MFSIVLPLLLLGGVAGWYVWSHWARPRRAAGPSGTAPAAPGEEAAATAMSPAPAAGATASARERLCPHCGALNRGAAPHCTYCNLEMPSENLLTLLHGDDDNRGLLLRELARTLVPLLVVLVALTIASWMGPTVKILIIIVTLGGLGYRFLKSISPE